MRKNKIVLIILLLFSVCNDKTVHAQKRIGDIPLPSSAYDRLAVKKGSFAAWLRQLPLKTSGSPVLDYRGKIFKTGADSVVAAIVNININGHRLEQCMDIIVRLYADSPKCSATDTISSMPM